MNDQEFLDYFERTIFETMLQGCVMDDHVGYKTYKPGVYEVSFPASELARLLDMAIANNKCIS